MAWGYSGWDDDPSIPTKRKKAITMQAYPSSLSDFQWSIIEKFFRPSRLGRTVIHCRRQIVDAILYVLRSGCQWEMLPHDFPPRSTVYDYFMKWKNSGLWTLVNARLNMAARKANGRMPSPSLAVIDSQSVKGVQGRQKSKGIDGFKKVNGRKRHLIVDVLGLVLACVVTPANVHDSQACELAVEEAFRNQELERLELLIADKGYRGDNEVLIPLRFDVDFQICSKVSTDGFEPRPKRWVVERSNAWLSASRRTARDYEVYPESSVAWAYIANIRLALGKIEKPA